MSAFRTVLIAALVAVATPFAAQAAEWVNEPVSEQNVQAWVYDDPPNAQCAVLLEASSADPSGEESKWLFYSPRGNGGMVFAENVDGAWKFFNKTDGRGARRIQECMTHFNDMQLYDLVRRDADPTKAAALLGVLGHLEKWLNASAK